MQQFKKIYGYIRVSTDKQDTANQRFQIKNFAKTNNLVIDEWVEETISSRIELKRRMISGLLEKMCKDDLLIACELSRLGRNLMQIMGMLSLCMDKESKIWTIKDNYRLGNTIESKVLAFAFGLSAEIERDLISARTKEALARRRSEGVQLGRPVGKKSDVSKLTPHHDEIKKLLDSGISFSGIGRIVKANRLTVSTYVYKHDLIGKKKDGRGQFLVPQPLNIDISNCIVLYKELNSISALAKHYGCSADRLTTELKRIGFFEKIRAVDQAKRKKNPSKRSQGIIYKE